MRNLNLQGTAEGAASALASRLCEFGRLDDRHSLSYVLSALRERVGDDQQAEIDELISLLDAQGSRQGSNVPAGAARMVDVLHLSDLHFGTGDDARLLHNQLAEDLTRELQCSRLDGLILTGDMTMICTEQEFAAARTFVHLLAREFGLAPERIVVAPGNHDLGWDASKSAYKPHNPDIDRKASASERALWIIDESDDRPPKAIHKRRDDALYPERFRLFSDAFHEPVTGVPYPLDYADQFRFHHWPDLGLLVLSLNSAWQIDHVHEDRAGIHPLAVSNVLDALRARPEWASCLEIAVWHHPLASDEPSHIADHGFVERLAAGGFRLGLHGHIHKNANSLFRYDQSPGGRRMDILAAGTFGAPSHHWVPGYPAQYQLLRLRDGKLSVETRRRETQNGTWKPDARWLQGPGRDPLPRYGVDL